MVEMENVNCFGIPSKYRGWSITQECDDNFYGWDPNYEADYNDEDGFVGNGESCSAATWEGLREEIDAYIAEHPNAVG